MNVQQFEVASVKTHEGPLRAIAQLRISGSLVSLEGYNPFLLICEAWGIKAYQVEGARLDDTFYDISARAPEGIKLTREDVRLRLRALMAERFRLTAHGGVKEIPVLALAAAKGGSKLQEDTALEKCSIHIGGEPHGNNSVDLKSCSTAEIVDAINSIGSKMPVVDRTGLTSRYTAKLVYSPRSDGTNPDDISVSTALQEYGLKLEKQSAKVETVVVDHIEKPSGN